MKLRADTGESTWIAVHLPLIELEAFIPCWQHGLRSSAIVVLKQNRVIAMSHTAMVAGVRVGMRRGGVQMLLSDVDFFTQDNTRETAALSAIALALLRYTPQVSFAEEASILLDIGASIRLFGGLPSLRRLVRSTVKSLGYSPTIGCAPTAKTAWLFARNAARIGRLGQSCLRTTHISAATDRLSVDLLIAAASSHDLLQGLACHSLADLKALPRAGLQRRCGKSLLAELDLAYSSRSTPQIWIVAAPEFCARIELPDRSDSTETLFTYSRSLLSQLLGWLHAHQFAVKQLRLELQHERGRQAVAPSVLDIDLAVASWQESNLLPLLKEKISLLRLPGPVISLVLKAPETVTRALASDSLFPETVTNPADHQHLLGLLVARLGAAQVLRPCSQEDHRPEFANQWISVMEPSVSTHSKESSVTPLTILRPRWLLAQAIVLEVRRHKPYLDSELTLISPAERIEAGWWTDQTQVRDYFVAVSADHIRYWIYRERSSHRNNAAPAWFLHGIFG